MSSKSEASPHQSSGHLVKRFLPYYKKYWPTMVMDLFCAAVVIGCEMLFPLIVKDITDKAIYNITEITVVYVTIIAAIYMATRIVDVAANYYMQYQGHVMGAKMETDMRREMFMHLQYMSHSYYNETKIGQLMSRMTSDLFEVTEFAHHGPEEVFIGVAKILACFGILCAFNVYMTLIVFALIPVMLFITSYFKKRMHKAFRAQRKQLGEINSKVEDSLLGVRVVKSFANEEIEIDKFHTDNKKFFSIKKEVYGTMTGFLSVTRFFDGLMYISVLVTGALFLANGQLEVGEFTASMLYVSALLQSIRRLVEFTEQFGRGVTGVERFFEIIDTPALIEDKADAIELTDVEGNIVFEDVTFTYGKDDTKIFNALNFAIPQGHSVAIVGASGTGKTTISNLIPRFYEIEEGRITIDGIDIRDVKLKSLRDNIGIVQQDVYMFSGSVRENILYGRLDATEEEMIRAVRMSGAEEFINKLPNGYDSYVGEKGVMLSGGQKQRISIARVFLKNPPILILDEATSALDNESERLVQQSLEQLSRDRTTITIAHRLSTIQKADEIIVLDIHGIAERGTHDELVAKCGEYYHMLNA